MKGRFDGGIELKKVKKKEKKMCIQGETGKR
jgi:hypothetical protein